VLTLLAGCCIQHDGDGTSSRGGSRRGSVEAGFKKLGRLQGGAVCMGAAHPAVATGHDAAVAGLGGVAWIR
jgi:hypothetical protein